MSSSILVGVSGIDGSGKGYVTDHLVNQLQSRGTNAAVLHGDGWLNLPHKRFNANNPAMHFYENALRLEEMFEHLVLPLKHKRSHSGIMDFAEETATSFREQRFKFENVDVIVLECIYLFKQPFRHHFDVAIWIDCSLETALRRAITRAQEGLAPAETIRAYDTIYFPAQKIHFAKDRPRETADVINDNNADAVADSAVQERFSKTINSLAEGCIGNRHR